MSLKTLLRTVAVLCMCAMGALAHSQNTYPAKPVSLVVGYPPGGSTDGVARRVARVLSDALGASVVVDNIGGATGAIGAQKVVRAAPDGYTLLLGATNELVATKLFNPQQAYDGLTDFTYIGSVEHQGAIILASPKSGLKTMDDLVQRLKSNPASLNYGTSGVGSMLHFAMELFMQKTQSNMVHVPYRGVSPLGIDIAGNNIEVGVMGLAAAKALIDAGKVVPLAVTTKTRLAMFPNVPAMAEHPMLKDYEVTGWFVIAGPKGMPAPVVAKLQAALKTTLRNPDFRRQVEEGGGVPASEGEDVMGLVKMETARYKTIVK